MGQDFDYDRWYSEVPAVMEAKQLADLLQTSDQIVRLWVREGIIPAHRKEGGRKWFTLEIVETLDLGSEDESYGKQVNIKEADYASVHAGGEGSGGASGASTPQRVGDVSRDGGQGC
jgi:hypothetical protein